MKPALYIAAWARQQQLWTAGWLRLQPWVFAWSTNQCSSGLTVVRSRARDGIGTSGFSWSGAGPDACLRSVPEASRSRSCHGQGRA